MVRAVLVTIFGAGLLLSTTACGGGDAEEREPTAKEKRAAARAARKKSQGPEPDERPPAKLPRPPFLSLPESDPTATTILKKGQERQLAALPQRGPFGRGETTTVLFTEPSSEEGPRVLGGVVVVGSVAHVLPIDNEYLLASKPEVVWVSGEHGWQIVVMHQRTQDDAPVQRNQAFYWDGSAYVRDLASEEQVKTMTSPTAIRQALL